MKTPRYAIINSSLDPAGKNIRGNLLKLEIPSNVILYETDKEIVRHECIDREPELKDCDFFIFASKHQSKSGIPSFSVHPIGNFGSADFGGKERELCISMPGIMKRAFLLMKYKAPLEYDIIYEATHHGPYLEKPSVFIEIGTSEKEWNNKEAGAIMAEIILETIKLGPVESENSIPAICIGGQHTCTNFLKIMQKTQYSLSHCCPKYALDHLNDEMLLQCIKKSNEPVKTVLLDWKGLGEHKERVIKMLEDNKLEYIRIDKIGK